MQFTSQVPIGHLTDPPEVQYSEINRSPDCTVQSWKCEYTSVSLHILGKELDGWVMTKE